MSGGAANYSTSVTGIDSLGDSVVGYCTNPSTGNSSGFLYRNGAFTTIAYPGAINTIVLGINSAGTMVGYYGTSGGGGTTPSSSRRVPTPILILPEGPAAGLMASTTMGTS